MMNITSAFIWNNLVNKRIYATKDYDIAKCIDKAYLQCGTNRTAINYCIHCNEDNINKLIKDLKAIII